MLGAPETVPQGALTSLTARVGRQGATGPARPLRPAMGRPLGARVVQVASRDAVLGRRQGRRLGRLTSLNVGAEPARGTVPEPMAVDGAEAVPATTVVPAGPSHEATPSSASAAATH